jgi:hypothetical protein
MSLMMARTRALSPSFRQERRTCFKLPNIIAIAGDLDLLMNLMAHTCALSVPLSLPPSLPRWRSLPPSLPPSFSPLSHPSSLSLARSLAPSFFPRPETGAGALYELRKFRTAAAVLAKLEHGGAVCASSQTNMSASCAVSFHMLNAISISVRLQKMGSLN